MEISIGSYKLRVEIVVAIVVVFWVMFGHLLCSCCKVSLFEGFNSAVARRKGLVKNKLQTAIRQRDAAQDEVDKLTKEMSEL